VTVDELRLHLDGPALGIDARALRDGLASLLKLVTSVEDGAENSAPEVWVLSDLSIASVDCAVTAVPGFEVGGRARFETVWSGAQQLAASPGIPDGWAYQTVQAVLELVDLAKFRGVEGAQLSRNGDPSIHLDAGLKANAERSLSSARESLGEVRGAIVRYVNDGKRREVSVRDASMGQRSIRVTFSNELDRDILIALTTHSRVSIWGTLRRNAEGQKLSLSAEGLKILESVDLDETVESMAGALGRDWTGELNSVDWARRQRSE